MNLSEIRERYPQYDDLSDADLVTGFHSRFYNDMPFADFAKAVGYTAPKRSWGEAASDTAVSFGSGAGALVEGAGTLYGLATGDMDNATRRLGADTQEYYNERKSETLKAAEEERANKIKGADGFFEEAGTAIAETVKNPALLGSFAAEQVPMFVGPGIAGRAAGMVGGAGARTGAAVGAGATLQGADVGSDAYEQAKKIALAQGMSPAEAEAEALSVARKAAPAAGAISVASQFIPGGRTIERALSGAEGRVVGRGAGLMRGALGESLSEATEEGAGKVASNIFMRELDPSIPLTEGAGQATGMGALGGFGMGGAVGVLEAKAKSDPIADIIPIVTARTYDESIVAASAAMSTPDEAPGIAAAEAALDAPVAIPAAAPIPEAVTPRPVDGLGLTELTQAARLTRSEDRRAEISAELERRAALVAGDPVATTVPQEPTNAPLEAPGAPAAVQPPIEPTPTPQTEEAAPLAEAPLVQSAPVYNETVQAPETVQPLADAQQSLADAKQAPTQVAAEPVARFDDYAAPADIVGTKMVKGKKQTFKRVIKGETRTFKSEKYALAFAKQNKVKGYTPRELEPKVWALSKPAKVVTQEQQAIVSARAAQRMKDRTIVRSGDDALTVVKKIGGWNADDAMKDGVDPATVNEFRHRGGVGTPIFRKSGGKSIDGIAEALAHEGFDVLDEDGSVDATKAREIMHDALAGNKVYSPEGATIAAETSAPDRRQDPAQRKRVADMTPEEKDAALLVDDLTGIGNRRAFEEAPRKPVHAAVDADNLKWVNDNLGHEAGDDLLKAIGSAMKREGLEAYHVSGDEFVAQFDDEAAAYEAMGRVKERLFQATITAVGPDGTRITKKGVDFSYGLGPDSREAEIGLQRDKAEREDSGLRAARGAEPPGVAREPAVQAKPPRDQVPRGEVTESRESRVSALRSYARAIVDSGKVRSVTLVGSALTSATPKDTDLVYDLGPGLNTEEAVEAALAQIDGLDLDKFDTFIKSDNKYFHVSSGAGRSVVANDNYAAEQAGKPRELLAGATAPKAMSNPIADLLREFDEQDGSTKRPWMTERDVLERIEEMDDIPDQVREAAEAYRESVDEDRDTYGGRNETDEPAEALIEALRAVAKKNPAPEKSGVGASKPREIGVSTSGPTIADVPPGTLKRITVPIERFHEGEGIKVEQVSAAEALAEIDAEIDAYEKLRACVAA